MIKRNMEGDERQRKEQECRNRSLGSRKRMGKAGAHDGSRGQPGLRMPFLVLLFLMLDGLFFLRPQHEHHQK